MCGACWGLLWSPPLSSKGTVGKWRRSPGQPSQSTPRISGIKIMATCAHSSSRSCTQDTRSPLCIRHKLSWERSKQIRPHKDEHRPGQLENPDKEEDL